MEISLDKLCQRAAKIKWFFCDVDGTLTDGCVYYSSEGELLKKFSLRDGTGFFLLKQCDIKTGFITTENSPIVAKRAQKLNVDRYIFGTHRKLEAMKNFCNLEGISLDNIAYIGDEINDIKLLSCCGLGFAVGDADEKVKQSALLICKHKGGDGAFREAVDILLKLQDVNIDIIISDTL